MQLIDIAGWEQDSSFTPYPEGSRDKYAVFAPANAVTPLIAGHRYLVKFSNQRYPTQYWCEIIARVLATPIGVPVPPTWVSVDPVTGQPASLVAWFYGDKLETTPLDQSGLAKFARAISATFVKAEEIPANASLYVPGSNYMMRLIENYDFKKGKQHNFVDFMIWIYYFQRVFGVDYWAYWVKIFLFDAIIGNTDRHQDNWGVLWRRNDEMKLVPRYAPAFDNGTALLHEITEVNLSKFRDANDIDRYIDKGLHHIRWDLTSPKRAGHFELLSLITEHRPHLKGAIATALTANFEPAFDEVRALTQLVVPIPLSVERAESILRVVGRRIERLRAIYL
jgi:hypothetical protein